MKSKFYTFSKEELKNLIDNSNSIAEIFKKINMTDSGNGSRKIFFKCVKEKGLDEELEKLRQRTREETLKKLKRMREKAKDSYEEIFKENSLVSRRTVKDYLIKDNLIPYKCSVCGNTGEWLGKKLSLQIDHINGINNDHRLENLRFLCPNCHSQTETFSGKHKRKK